MRSCTGSSQAMFIPYKWQLTFADRSGSSAGRRVVDAQSEGRSAITTCYADKCMRSCTARSQAMFIPYKWQLTFADRSCSIAGQVLIDAQCQGNNAITTCCADKCMRSCTGSSQAMFIPYKWQLSFADRSG